MNAMKVIALLAGGVFVTIAVGGGIVWYRRRKKQKEDGKKPQRAKPGPKPNQPPRQDTRARGDYVGTSDVHPELQELLDSDFPAGWPPDETTIDNLEADDVIVFAVESEGVGPYENTRQELIQAKVLSVETAVVRARIFGEVRYSEHFGSYAGHGFRVGDLVEVPRDKVLVAARLTDPKGSGYGSEGKPANTFKPSNVTKQVYRVRPGTAYDLVTPYRTPEMQWHIDRDMVKMVHVGSKGSLEQILFSEDSMRGAVSVRAIDHDPKEGAVFVARWDFTIDP